MWKVPKTMTLFSQKYSLLALMFVAVACFFLSHYHYMMSFVGIGVILVTLVMSVISSQERPPQSLPSPTEDNLGARRIRALIVGAGGVGQTLAKHLEADGRYCVVGFMDDESAILPAAPWQILGKLTETSAIIREYDIEEVFVAYAPTWQQKIAEELTANHAAVRVRIVPSPYESLMRLNHVESRGDIALVSLAPEAGKARQAVKRLGDILMAVCSLVLFAPLMALTTLLIKLTSRGPVIFAQERIGYCGKPFILYKFRTMIHDAEAETGPTLSSGRDDVRLTSIGRWLRLFRIDELPQLWNVLRGDMSMVGPRPERPHFVQKYQRMAPTYARRHQVRPGITGLAQVCGGYHTDARDKLRFDLIYVSHHSLWLDVSILMRTILVVLLPNRR
jgi:exopolysaccharide biosynthesis polyprenyl glycosylphosphotransferase